MYAIILTLVSLLMAGLSVSAVQVLARLEAYQPPHLTEAILRQGHIHHFLLANSTWQMFPALPFPINLYLDSRALLIMFSLAACIWFLNKRMFKLSGSNRALLLLFSSLVPYVFGLFALHNNQDIAQSGPWLATMLLSVFYGSMLAVSSATANCLSGLRSFVQSK